MADESENPVTGTDAVPTTEDEAVASISARLRGEPQRTTPEPKPKTGKENIEPKDQADSGEDEPVSGDESNPKAVKAEDDNDDGVEFPDTLEGIAEKEGVDPEELANHVRLSVKQPDGTLKEVSLAELRNNYFLQSDYSRKTAELAREKEAFTASIGQQSQQFQHKQTQLDTLMSVLAQQIEQGPSDADLNRLAVEDPAAFVAANRKREMQMAAFRQAWEHKAAQEAQATHERAERTKATRAEQQRLLAQKMPELAKPDEAQKFEREMAETLRGVYGYSDAEIGAFVNGGFDHRQVLLVRDAMKFRAGQKAGEVTKKKLVGLPKVIKAGASPSKGEEKTTKLEEARRRLRSPKTRNDRKASEAAGLELVTHLLRG